MKIFFSILIAILVLWTIPSVVISQESQDNFEVSQKLVQVKLKSGEDVNREIKIFNRLANQMTLENSFEGLNNTVVLGNPSYKIEGHSEGITKLLISGRQTGVFVGKLIFSDNKIKNELPVIVEVESEKTAIAAKIEIPAEFRSTEPGKEIVVRLSMLSIGGQEEKRASVFYQIISFDNNIIFREEEILSFNSTLTVTRRFPLPQSLSKGDYIIAGLIKEENTTSTATKIFQVDGQNILQITSDNIVYVLLGLILATVLVLYLNYGRLVKMEKRRPKITKIKERVIKSIVRERIVKVRVEGHDPKLENRRYKLQRQMESLNRAYKANYISKETYLKSKKKLGSALKESEKRYKKG